MDFRILGPLEVHENGQQLELGGAKQRALLAILLLHANEVVSTDRLIDALWEDDAPETGRKALQVYISQLRKTLGKDRIATHSPGYRLQVETDELDLARFQRLLEDGNPSEALSLWRGPPLADFAYERFAHSEIVRLEDLRLACLEDRIEADLAVGRHAALVGELESLVTEHPLRERLRVQHMLALYRSGRQAEALDAYRAARQALVEELGIEPSRQLRELQQAILAQDPALDAGTPTVDAGEVTEAPRGVFVGRESEVEALLKGFAEAETGRGRLFLLVGEPGIGKSRLADEVIRHARTHGATVIVGRCWEGGGAPAYWPWVQSIREYVRNVDPETLRAQLGPGAVDLAQIVPEVRDRLPDVPEPNALESESARFQLFDSTMTFLRNASVERPLVLVLEDLHASDEPSLLLLRFVAAALGGSRILVVGTYRDVDPTVRDPLAATLAELAREPITGRVRLTGLTETDVARFIELTADVDPSTALVAAIREETEGNPLFVGEVVRLLSSEGRLREADGRALSTLGIPQGIREVIGRRLRQLSDENTNVLTLAAVLGREFRLDVLERLSGLSANGLLDVLDEAISARVVIGVPDSRGRLRFAHALIRDTLYDELTTPRRVRLHRRVGDVLEALYEDAPEPHLAEIAHHFFEAAPGGDVDRAVEYARRAADQAVRLLAYEEGARLYASALEALELKPVVAANERCELLLGLGEAQARAGDESAALATFMRTADIARSAGLSAELARAALGYSGRFVWMSRGLGGDPLLLLEDALSSLGDEDSALRARLLARLAGSLRDHPEPERRNDLSAEAVAIARRLDDHAALAYALDGRYSAIWGPHNVAERLPLIDEILTLADEVGDRERTIQARFYRAVAYFELCQMSDLYVELEEMERVVNELRQPAQRWYVAVLRAILALFEGEFELASRELIPDAFEFGRTLHGHMPRGSFRVQLVLLHRERGEVDDCVVTAEELREWPTINAFECFVAVAYIEAGRHADARTILDRFAGIDFDLLLDNDKLWGWCVLAEASAALGEADHASRLYELLEPYADRNAVCHPAAALGSVARYLGLAASAFERYDDAERHLVAALDANERMGARPWLAHTQEDYARMLLARGHIGDRQKAQELLDGALASYRELGMEGPLAQAESVATE